MLGFVTLVVVTAYGVYRVAFGTADWPGVVARWRAMGFWVLLVLALAAADWTLEAVCWMWLYSRFRMRVRDGIGLSVYLAGHAGLFIPAQMGRLIRPDAVVRLDRGKLSEGIKAEAVLLFLDTAAAVIVVCAVVFYWIQPLAIPIVALGLSVSMLFVADRVTSLLSGTRVSLPPNFWRGGETFAMLWMIILGWLLNGLGLYALVRGLAQGITPLEVIFFASLSRIVGSGTGLPGGIGVTEGLLGISLRIMEIPVGQLILAVAAYRVLTFWVLLPIGWSGLLFVNHQVRGAHNHVSQVPDVGLK
jgi:uncharacterized membrane protein YbhN (UPF0104 family)